ncbi:hypothetical protein [Buchananella hordeovulneris]|uniref:hypothetical protein n=1 Tax=Buchananella hordeovulneris TaxID=52770 RepID=UPI001FEFDA37|nr:hypothetical protein [Buchananella hordeovulneris]
MLDDRRALIAEDIDVELGRGSEFTYDAGGIIEVHQVKRQNGNSNGWTVKALADLKIFEAAKRHVANGRIYHFVSLVPCRPLQELSDRARKSADLASFIGQWLTKELSPVFEDLSAAEVLGSRQAAWDTLRGMCFSTNDERDIICMNSMFAECILGGATGHLTSLAVGDILLDNLGKRLTRTELLALLAERDIKPLVRGFYQTAHERVLAITNSWRQSVQRELLQPSIERAEAIQLVQTLTPGQIGLLTGTAGGGKSSVLEQAVASLEATGAEVLALRLDRLDHFASTVDLGRQLGIETSPAVALALAAEDRAAYLVIDQLDAVSLASGRIPERFDVVMDLIGEALSMSGMRVVLACRQFDIDNDHRIRALASRSGVTKVEVGLLAEEDVEAAVASMGLDPTHLSPSQRVLLQTPLHLVLLQTISSQPEALAFQSKGSLFEAFWERKRQTARARRQDVRFNEVVSRIANAASDRQMLSVPIEILDDGDLIEDANVLVSEQVLARDNGRIAFFHEAFFDYAFARLWVSRAESLVEFLCRGEQALFRRAQVRQILQHLYEREPERFRAEVEAVLTSDDIRFHIKETVLAVVANLVAPTFADAKIMLRVAETHPRFEDRLWQQLRQPQWFVRFYNDGQITAWLDGPDEDMRNRALNAMASAVKDSPEAIAVLLEGCKSSPEYHDWLRWISRFADMWRDRQLFALVLEGVRQGAYDAAEHELWLTMHDLAKHEPLWAIELLQARLIDHSDALTLNEEGKVPVLGMREYGAAELVKNAAAAEPLAFVQVMVPYLRQVMAATAKEERGDHPIRDGHFSWRFVGDGLEDKELGEALLAASVCSLEKLAKTSPEPIRSLLDDLALDLYDASQFLLYRALSAGGKHFADWAATLLLEGGRRLDCGYISDSNWAAREVVRAIAPYVTDATHQQLENLFRDLRNEYENRPSWGYSAFKFLSALEESRLTPVGRRRLEEYRRKFERDVPAKPLGITVGFIDSPISPAAAQKMTDEQWLSAMAKHSSDETNAFTGGAHQLSSVLKDQVAADPARFARLTLQLTSEFNAAYTNALLMGFGDAAVSEGTGPLIFEAVRHIASLRQADNDRWLGMALRKYYREVPLDLVELIRDRILHAPDPADGSPVITSDGRDGKGAADMRMNGISTARGGLAEALGDLLIADSDGQRTALVAPYLSVMASDPVLSVRSCVAHTLAASLRYARPEVLTAFATLIEADDRFLAAESVQRLMLYIGNVNPEVIDPIIQRMLASEDAEVREAGGAIAAFAALEWERPDLMHQALSGDLHIRKAVAQVTAWRVVFTANAELATVALIRLMNDDADEVRKEAAGVVRHLREQPLQPFIQLLMELINSPSFAYASSQLLLALKGAPDKVDELILKALQRFLDVFGSDAADIRTGAAADAYYVSELVVRGLAQCQDHGRRAALLDILDLLLELGVYGINAAIEESERI